MLHTGVYKKYHAFPIQRKNQLEISANWFFIEKEIPKRRGMQCHSFITLSCFQLLEAELLHQHTQCQNQQQAHALNV